MSYCTVEYADRYLSGRAFADAWSGDLQKATYLMLATELIEDFCTFYDDNGDAFSYADDMEVPEWLQKATAEEALYLVNLGKDPTQADKKTTLGIASTEGTAFDKDFSADMIGVRCRRIIENNGGVIDSGAVSSGNNVEQGWIRK